MIEPRYDTFVSKLSDLTEDQEVVLSVRDLSPGIHKYTYKYVRARVSSSSDAYPDALAVRFGRGQLCGERYSIQIVEELPRIPDKYA